jgi:hypothetical protein
MSTRFGNWFPQKGEWTSSGSLQIVSRLSIIDAPRIDVVRWMGRRRHPTEVRMLVRITANVSGMLFPIIGAICGCFSSSFSPGWPLYRSLLYLIQLASASIDRIPSSGSGLPDFR